MVTLNQYISKKIRKQRKKKIFKLGLSGCPQKKGFCLKIVIRSPKNQTQLNVKLLGYLYP